MWAVEIIYDDQDLPDDEFIQHVRGFRTEDEAWEYIDLHQPNRPDILDMYPIREHEIGLADPFDRANADYEY